MSRGEESQLDDTIPNLRLVCLSREHNYTTQYSFHTVDLNWGHEFKIY